MRLTATSDFATYDVYLDGVKQKYVFEADDVLGKIWKYCMQENADGTHTMLTYPDGSERWEVLHGHVEFRSPCITAVPENQQSCVRGDKDTMTITVTGTSRYQTFTFDMPVLFKEGDTLIVSITSQGPDCVIDAVNVARSS